VALTVVETADAREVRFSGAWSVRVPAAIAAG
jgi:hypothetical protein